MLGGTGIAILGGSFNPVHIGHLRLAIEVYENLQVQRVDLVPAFFPPHKREADMLPFALRVEMLQAAVNGIAGLTVNALEGERPGPSYTWDTLGLYAENNPGTPLSFILSMQDLATLPFWRNGPEIVNRASLLVAPRAGENEAEFQAVVSDIWGECAVLPPPAGCVAAYTVRTLTGKGSVALLKWSVLNISSSAIRLRRQVGADIRFLVPEAVLQIMDSAGALFKNQTMPY